jgi:hypothetical protein
MYKQIPIVAALLALCLATSAQASLQIVPLVGGQPAAGANYVNFDAPLVNPNGALTLSLTPNAQLVTGSQSGQYAAPFISNSNGVLFGDNTVSGQDATQYVTSGSTGSTAGAEVTMTFSSPQQYLGLLWGSVDNYNTLTFYSGANSVGSIVGTQVDASATGDQGVNGTFYVNINSTLAFDRVVATSTQFAFEFDNVAYKSSQIIVPEAASFLIWGGLASISMFYRRRLAR